VDLDLEGKSAIVTGGRLDIFVALQIVRDDASNPGGPDQVVRPRLGPIVGSSGEFRGQRNRPEHGRVEAPQ
jgi:hypothetical protein